MRILTTGLAGLALLLALPPPGRNPMRRQI